MDGMVEENGTAGNPGGDPLAHSPGDTNTSVVVTSVQSSSSEQHHLVAATSIVQLTLPTHVNNSTATAQVQGCLQLRPPSLFWPSLIFYALVINDVILNNLTRGSSFLLRCRFTECCGQMSYRTNS